MNLLTPRPGTMLALVLMLALAALPTTTPAQRMAIEMDGEGIEGQPYIIAELGALIVFKNQKLEVMHVMDKSMRPKEYLKVDIKAGDLLVMLNGSRLKTLEALKEALEEAKTGETLKFGIKRDKEMRMIKFAKADPKSLPKMGGMRMAIDDGGGEDSGPDIQLDGVDGPLAMLMGSGIIANETDDGIVIAALMPQTSKNFGEQKVSEGDRIVSVQGVKITELAQLSELYDQIPAGKMVKMILARGDKEYQLSFKKKAAQGGPNIEITH